MNDVDRDWMLQALGLAERGWGRVHPNPLVGALVVRAGHLAGQGFHEEFGQAHAEINALRQAGEAARGATLYVTLEPCAHHGKTPPCTAAILDAGITRVVYGVGDPSPVAGGGAHLLRDSGIEVTGAFLSDAVRLQNAAFFHRLERGTTFFTLKYALSLDFRIAASPGVRTQLSGAESMQRAHQLRAGFDAILTGIGTVLIDDPLLTVRGPVTPRVPPARIVLDTAARLPLGSKLVRTIEQAPVVVFVAEDADRARRAALEQAGARVLPAPRSAEGLDLEAIADALWREGFHSVMVEGGSRIATSLLALDQVERMFLFMVPRVLGAEGVVAFGEQAPIDTLFHASAIEHLGDDLYVQLERMRGLVPMETTIAGHVHGIG